MLTLLTGLLLSAPLPPMVPLANGDTPTTLVSRLAVKRDWTLEDNAFCQARARTNQANAYPKVAKAGLKFIKTFSFRSKSTTTDERFWIGNTDVGFQVPFPWQDGQWLARQYTAQATPQYTYLLEMQDRPKGQGPSAGASSICLTVYGIR